MLIKSAPDIKSSEIADPAVFHNRRRIIKAASLALGTTIAPPLLMSNTVWAGEKYANVVATNYKIEEATRPAPTSR